MLKDSTANEKDQLQRTWIKGDATTIQELGAAGKAQISTRNEGCDDLQLRRLYPPPPC